MRRLIDWFLGKPDTPPALRNKPGCMAWIKGISESPTGAAQLNNRVVKTIRFFDGKWDIEPRQFFIARTDFFWDGKLFLRGDAVGVVGVIDACLEPWKDTGLRQEDVSDLFAPAPVVKATTPAPTSASIRGH